MPSFGGCMRRLHSFHVYLNLHPVCSFVAKTVRKHKLSLSYAFIVAVLFLIKIDLNL